MMSDSYAYADVAIPRPLEAPFTYEIPPELRGRLCRGSRVLVPFGRARTVGFVQSLRRTPPESSFAIKPIDALLDEEKTLLTPELCDLAQWVADTYCCTWAEAADAMIPAALRRHPFRARESSTASAGGRVESAASAESSDAGNPPLPDGVDAAWRARFDQACREPSHACLVVEATPAQRTQMYRHAVERVVASGRTALWLVPEIAFTERLEELLGPALASSMVVLHGKLRVTVFRERWLKAATGEARVVLGTRSAVFSRMPHLGLIIVDDEQDASYKPGQMPRYHVRETAVERARLQGIPVILGSVLPSLDARIHAQRAAGALARLPWPRPVVSVVDQRDELQERRSVPGISRALRYRLEELLRAGEQGLLYLNRRGFAAAVRCPQCSYLVECPRCGVANVYHFSAKQLQCHYCGTQESMPEVCPSCRQAYLRFRGLGTERLESELHRLFPGARIARVDSDVLTDARALARVEDRLRDKQLDVLVATQLVHRSLHRLPPMALAAAVAADMLLNHPDFRAAEQALHWFVSLAGVVEPERGRLLIQTFVPEHPALRALESGDDRAFWEEEWALRQAVRLPPACHVVQIDGWGPEDAVKTVMAEMASAVREILKDTGNGGDAVAGPFACRVGSQRRQGHRLTVRVGEPLQAVMPRIRVAIRGRRLPRGMRLSVEVD